jgi:hypothetical protein
MITKSRRFFSRLTFKLDYFYNEGLPDHLGLIDPVLRFLCSTSSVLGQHKHLHYRNWFRRELAGYVKDVVTDPQTKRMPFWESEFLEVLAAEHVQGRRNYVNEINIVLTLSAIDRLLLKQYAPALRRGSRAREQAIANRLFAAT